MVEKFWSRNVEIWFLVLFWFNVMGCGKLFDFLILRFFNLLNGYNNICFIIGEVIWCNGKKRGRKILNLS